MFVSVVYFNKALSIMSMFLAFLCICIFMQINVLLWHVFMCVFSLTSTTNLERAPPPSLYLQAAYKWLLHFSNCFFIDKRLWSVVRALPVSVAFIPYWILSLFFPAALWLTELRVASSFLCVYVCARPFVHLWVVNVCAGVSVCRAIILYISCMCLRAIASEFKSK